MRSIYHMDPENMAELEHARLAKLEERTKSNIRRLDRLERLTDEVHAQNEQIARLTVRLETLTAQLLKLEKRLSEMEYKPMRRMDRILGALGTAFASALMRGLMGILF